MLSWDSESKGNRVTQVYYHIFASNQADVYLPLFVVARAQRSVAPAVRRRPMAAMSAKTTTGVRAMIASRAKRRLRRRCRRLWRTEDHDRIDVIVTAAAIRLIRPSSSSLRRVVSNVHRPRADWLFARRTKIEKEKY